MLQPTYSTHCTGTTRSQRPWLVALLATLVAFGALTGNAPLLAAPVQAPPAYPVPPPGCYEAVMNGGFEQVGATWVLTSSPRPPQYDATQIYEGALAMRMGIVDLPNAFSDSAVYQDITLPAGATLITLSFRYYPQFDSAPGANALQYVNITNLFNGQFVAQPLSAQRNDRTWLFQQYDLTAQAGQQIRLALGVRNDGVGGRLAMWADNVSIIVCSATPFLTPTPTINIFPTATPTFNMPTPFIPTWTPTVTPSPLPTLPSGCTSDTIQNGGFESDSAWIFGDDPVRGAFVSIPIHTGLRSVRLGIDPAAGSAGVDRVSYSSIRQPFMISPQASTAQLRWWQFNRTEEAPLPVPPASADRQEVILLQPELKTETILSRVRSNDTGWTQQLVELP